MMTNTAFIVKPIICRSYKAGTLEYNKELFIERIINIVEFLISNGIEAKLIESKDYDVVKSNLLLTTAQPMEELKKDSRN